MLAMKYLYCLLLPLLLTACLEDECRETVTFTAYTPVTITASEWRSDVFTPTASTTGVCDPSGFYVYGNYLLVLDRNAGLHLIDNQDNAHPRPIGFIPIPGGQGLAVRNNILYVNQYIDLLAFDISAPEAPRFLSRTTDVFNPYSVFAGGLDAEGNYIASYVESTDTREVDCSSPYFDLGYYYLDNVLYAARGMDFAALNSAVGGVPETVGQGGSLARFTISEGTLFAVDDNTLHTFSLDNPAKPEFMSTSELPYGVETIFPSDDLLFIGSTTGLHIYSVENPLAPAYLSTFEHVRSCDPVVVQGDLAYVTMWGGSECGNQGDQLMVVDVSDPRNPSLVQETPMQNSHGLGIDGDRLFLCTGYGGIRVFSLLEDGRLGPQVHEATGFAAKDVIVLPGQQRLIALGWEQAGIEQYDYTEDGAPTAISHFSVCD